MQAQQRSVCAVKFNDKFQARHLIRQDSVGRRSGARDQIWVGRVSNGLIVVTAR